MNDRHRREDAGAAFDPAEQVNPIGGPTVGGGTLPPWFLRAVVGASALIALAVLLATGGFTIVLFFVVTAVIALPTAYIWSRLVENRRQAMDRLVTLGIVAAFFIAVAPLFSVLFEVLKRGTARFDGPSSPSRRAA